MNRWALPVSLVRRLLSRGASEHVVDEVLEELRESYDSGAVRPYHKAWRFGYAHRDRFHVSAVLGLHGRWPWPVVPYFDTRMLDLAGALPYEHLRGRRMQYDMLTRRFPDLARAPLDRNTFNMKPVAPRYGRAADRALFKAREHYYRYTRWLVDRRFYYRTMDFGSPAWNAVREAAEPNRPRVVGALDEAAFAAALPRPGQSFTAANGIIDTAGMKLAAGLLLWSETYL